MRDELVTAVEAAGYSQADLAERLGVSQSTVSRWMQGLTRPRGPNRYRLEQLVQPDRTDGASDDPVITLRVHDMQPRSLADFNEHLRSTVPLHRWVAAQILGIDTHVEALGVVEMQGECMLPDLRHGDPVFFAYDAHIRPPGGRYVLWLDGHPVVKRVQALSDGSVVLRCENRSCGDIDELLVPNEDGALVLQHTGRPARVQPLGPILWPRQAAHRVLIEEVKTVLAEGYAEIAREYRSAS